jgi:hypothetical protein
MPTKPTSSVFDYQTWKDAAMNTYNETLSAAKSTYEATLPLVKKAYEDTKAAANPYNWGVPDYTDKGSWGPKTEGASKELQADKNSFGLNTRAELYPTEKTFFLSNLHIPGMYSKDTKDVVLNPYSNILDTPEKKQALVRLEGARGYMDQNNIVPNFNLTKEQEAFLTKVNYPKESWKQTVASRILVNDMQATPEQKAWVEKNLNKK